MIIETYEEPNFGKHALDRIAAAVGIAANGLQRCEIEFGYGQFGTVELTRDGKQEIYTCEEMGGLALKNALGLPYGVQQIVIRVGVDEFMIAEYRMATGDEFAKRLDSFLSNEKFIRLVPLAEVEP